MLHQAWPPNSICIVAHRAWPGHATENPLKKALHSLLHCSLALATAQTHKIRDAGCEVSGVRCGAAHPRGPLARGPRLTGNACPCLAASRGESRRHCLPCHPCRRPPWPGAGVEAPPLSLPFPFRWVRSSMIVAIWVPSRPPGSSGAPSRTCWPPSNFPGPERASKHRPCPCPFRSTCNSRTS